MVSEPRPLSAGDEVSLLFVGPVLSDRLCALFLYVFPSGLYSRLDVFVFGTVQAGSLTFLPMRPLGLNPSIRKPDDVKVKGHRTYRIFFSSRTELVHFHMDHENIAVDLR